MTDTKTLTDLIPGGGTVELTVTARTSNLDIESTILAAQRKQATVVHNRLAEQVASWRRSLYEMRAELGGEPAPESHTSTLPPVPMPGRMRCWRPVTRSGCSGFPSGRRSTSITRSRSGSR